MPHKDDCIFCQIVRGQSPCHLVYEDNHSMAFMDAFPSATGHVLIITKEHFSDIFEATPEAIAALGAVSVSLAEAINMELTPDGLGIFQLNKAAAGQTVFHYHMHLIPRNEGEELSLHSKTLGDPEQLSALALRLRSRLGVT